MDLPSDAELLPLVERMASGDPDALVAFHAAVGPWALAAIEAIVGAGQGAELLHGLFVTVWQEAPAYDRHFGRPVMWVLAAAREAAVASLDRRRRGALDGALPIAADHPLTRIAPEHRDALLAAWRGALPSPDTAADALRALIEERD